MEAFNTSFKKKEIILALGPESVGNFSVFSNGKIYYSSGFGDLLDDKNFQKFKKAVLKYLQKNKIKPRIILTDLHPLYKTTIWRKELSKKFGAKHIQVQHHFAHIFSCYGEQFLKNNYELRITNFGLRDFIGIACDGTGYGLDGKIWGGEVFKISNFKFLISNKFLNFKFQIQRIGYLENQIMIGGDLAVREPARMLIAILAKIKNLASQIQEQKSKIKKNFIYQFVKKFYTKNQFEILYGQLQQNFNCQETSSTGRVLDAVSILLGFSQNQRQYKHQPIDLLEKNSTIPYRDLQPELEIKNSKFILKTVPLFEYLINNLHRDKKRLGATAQLYLAQGFHKIVKTISGKQFKTRNIYFSGGIAKNRIISSFLTKKGATINQILGPGDENISFGQIIYFLNT